MENIPVMADAPPPQGGGLGGPQGPPVPQLPPQMFTTAAQLLDLTDSMARTPDPNALSQGFLSFFRPRDATWLTLTAAQRS